MLQEICKLPDKEEWIRNFINSNTYHSVISQINQLGKQTTILFDTKPINGEKIVKITPRQRLLELGEIDLQPFYILDFISKNNNGTIHDIGCGFNFFKHFYPIVGIDPIDPAADIQKSFDKNFAIEYANSMDNIFSINAIHFCTIAEIEDRIKDFFNLVKTGGFAYLSINIKRVLEHTYEKITNVKNNNFRSKIENHYFPDNDHFSAFNSIFKKIISQINAEILLYQNMITDFPDESVNGNIRILIKRTA